MTFDKFQQFFNTLKTKLSSALVIMRRLLIVGVIEMFVEDVEMKTFKKLTN